MISKAMNHHFAPNRAEIQRDQPFQTNNHATVMRKKMDNPPVKPNMENNVSSGMTFYFN
jgi:hypothetical protein